MTTPTVPQSLFATMLLRLPDLAGLLIALVIVVAGYQAQEARLNALQEKYFALAQCQYSSRQIE